MATYLILLHPVAAFWALLELGALHEVDELLVVLVEGGVYFMLFASHVVVPLDATLQAVVLFADRAFEARAVLLSIEEAVPAVSCRAPRSRWVTGSTLCRHFCRCSS